MSEVEFVSAKYKLPQVVYHKGSYYLESTAEEKKNRKGPYPDYTISERPGQFNQIIPPAKEVNPATFMGDRRSHPSLRLRLYEVLQH